MQTISSISALRKVIQQAKMDGQVVTFVPTMGNLHEGHMQLVRAAVSRGGLVVASIFVNPLQFGANEDFESYPKTFAEDQAKLIANGCNLLFAPTVTDMYPQGQPIQTQVSVNSLAQHHCGASRPGHFAGVATVVTKLFGIVQPDVAFFGEKDFQQLAVIRQLTFDLSLPIEIVGVPTQRNEQGLALSSRNGYLSQQELEIASGLYRILQRTKTLIIEGDTDFDSLEASAEQALSEQGFTPDYFHICSQQTLEKAHKTDKTLVILAAATLGQARLIDNIAFSL